MQPSTTVSDQGMHCRLPEEKVYSFVAIGEEKFGKLNLNRQLVQYVRPYTD